MNIAIIAVAYNRVDSLSRLLSSLKRAYYEDPEITLIISIDKSKTNSVELFADSFHWPYGKKIVDKHRHNLGLKQHMFSLGKWFNEYDALIILEDDVVVAESYYSYVKHSVQKYSECDSIAGISLYSYSINYQTNRPFCPLKDKNDVYFMNCAMSWGQVWMRDSWLFFYQWYQEHKSFTNTQHLPSCLTNWGDKSWLKYHTRYCIENNKFFVYPYVALSTNFSDAGVHNDGLTNTTYQVQLQSGFKKDYKLPAWGESAVYYDGFFENLALYDFLRLTKEELCIDLCGEQNNRAHKRYWLTTKICNYKILKSYGLNYRPIEINILLNNAGKQIFLYDTFSSQKNLVTDNRTSYLYPYFLHNIIYLIRNYGLLNLLKDLASIIKRRV